MLTKEMDDLLQSAQTYGWVMEPYAKQLFALAGMDVPRFNWARNLDDVISFVKEVGYPVVMKGSAPAIQHKTDAGLVLLRIGDETEVREAYRTLETRAAAAGAALDGVLVEHWAQLDNLGMMKQLGALPNCSG